MPLPKYPRVVLQTNLLLNVGALVRFPAILRIAVELPAAFQEAIRSDYPVYSVVDATQVALPDNLPPEVQGAIRASIQGQLGLASPRAHRFSSPDGSWTIQLAQDYLVLGCTRYPNWETYRARLAATLEVLKHHYRPSYALGVSLRYQNGIVRSSLGILGMPWGRLLGNLTRGVFSNPELSEAEVLLCANQFDLRGPEKVKARVRHGLARVLKSQEQIYTIDNEFSAEEKVELHDVLAKFETFHEFSGSIFRECISDELFNLLGPSGSE